MKTVRQIVSKSQQIIDNASSDVEIDEQLDYQIQQGVNWVSICSQNKDISDFVAFLKKHIPASEIFIEEDIINFRSTKKG